MDRFRLLSIYLAGASLLAAPLLTPTDALAASVREQVFLFGGNFCPAGSRQLDPKLGNPIKDMPACSAEASCPKGSVARMCVYESDQPDAENFLASILLTGANFCPRGTARAEGQTLPIGQYSALFSLLGAAYGGDGRATFALPDLRGKGSWPDNRFGPNYCVVIQGKYPQRP